ncbi:MAG: dienelactone hydrolase family protein [Kiritimatiellae bacterium]|jgi:cephalosporin-C deacetylase-like acetyl esterase|nr:dienelactone hydrolase family protein [Kiritimatiellia bacterium]
MKKRVSVVLAVVVVSVMNCTAQVQLKETLAPLNGGKAPQNFEELWAGYDPRAEPLDVEVLKEWEEDGIVLKILRYRIGVFKGQKAMMAAVYGYPKGGRKLPGLVQIHGGGQYADYKACLTNGKRGYATISISWAGRINAPDYRVSPNEVKLFWDNKTDDPNYRITTDWGALDGYHAPCRNPKNAFAHVKPAEWTLDAVDSPRNNPWFLCTLGARRALTFLEQQPEVDKNKLGVYGHSMGGKLTVLTTGSDSRVKAAAPSCGGLSNRNTGNVLFDATVADDVYLKHIKCPIIFLSPANDFHGRINDLQTALTEIRSSDWRITCAPHHNHQDTDEYEVAGPLWFDQHLKGIFKYPQTPVSSLELKTGSGVPCFTVIPDDSKPVLSVDIFYTQQGIDGVEKDDRINTINRFWHYAAARKKGGSWSADLPLLTTDKPLWVYANVLYPLEKPVTGAGYYYGIYTTDRFNLSSRMQMVSPQQLKAAGIKAADKPSLVIESFDKDWEKEWFTYKPEEWGRKTHKLYDPKWKAPAGAKLALEVLSEQPSKLVIGIDDYAAEILIKGGTEWQNITLSPADFQDAACNPLSGWTGLLELRYTDAEHLKGKGDVKPRLLGARWKGAPPEFRNLRWVK